MIDAKLDRLARCAVKRGGGLALTFDEDGVSLRLTSSRGSVMLLACRPTLREVIEHAEKELVEFLNGEVLHG